MQQADDADIIGRAATSGGNFDKGSALTRRGVMFGGAALAGAASIAVAAGVSTGGTNDNLDPAQRALQDLRRRIFYQLPESPARQPDGSFVDAAAWIEWKLACCDIYQREVWA